MTDYSAMPDLLTAAEQKYNLPPGILHATYAVETSSGRNVHPSKAGALGPMQIMPDTAANLGVNPNDPAQAADAAGRIWQQNLKNTNGDIDMAAIHYVGGYDPKQWHQDTYAYPGKLAAALGPSRQQTPAPQTQGGGDPIEAALSGHPVAQPPAAPADPNDPIESALSAPPVDNKAIIAQASQLLHAGKEQEALALLGQHGMSPGPGELDAFHAGKRSSNFNPPVAQPAQPSAPQTDEGLGFYQGIMKPFDNAATWLKEGADKLGIGQTIDSLGSSLGLPSLQAANAGHQQYIQGQEAQGETPGKLGEFAGSVLSTLPIVAATKNPYLIGGLGSALDSDNPNNLKQVATNAMTGAIGGKLTDVAAGAISSAVAPQISKAVQALSDAGVPLTPGQIMGGALRRIEDASTSIPLLGDLVKSAQRRSVIGLNTAAINSALEPVGKSLPAGLTGREAVDFAHNAVTSEYGKILPQLHVQADPEFAQGLSDTLKTTAELPPERAAQVNNILRDSLAAKFDPAGNMSGQTFKETDEKLGDLAAEYTRSNDPEQRKMGSIFRDAQGEFRDLLTRSNPDHAEQLSSINQGFSKLVRIEGAAGSAGAKGGVFTPGQLSAAVKRYDSSARKNAFARGNAQMQDLSDAAQEVLPPTVPDSGTPLRMMAAYLLGGGLSAGHAAAGAVAAVPLSLYSKVGQKAFQSAVLAPRGPGAKALANALTKLKAPLAIAGGQASSEAAHAFGP